MDKLVKVNFSVSTNQRNDGKINTTDVLNEEMAEQMIEKLESRDKAMHLAVFQYLYNIGYLEARVRKIYECDIDGNYKE